MTRVQRLLVLGALALVVASSLGGLVHAWGVEHETLLALREQYRAAFEAAAARDMTQALAALGEAQETNYRYVRVIDAHTHFIKLAVVLVLAGLLVGHSGFGAAGQRLLGTLLLGGAVVFPLSVYLQTQVPGLAFKAGAAAGALAVIAAMTMLVWALWRRRPRP